VAIAAADEQVNANERTLNIYVAKGGLCEKASSTLFKPPAATWFSTLDSHYKYLF
jgi:hypothetical protein